MQDSRIIIALIVGLILLIGLIMKTKIHTFLALIITALFIGIAGGMEWEDVIESVTGGFGGTLGSIGIIIGFGVMMGQVFEISNAAKRMASSFIKIFGKGKEDIAMAVTGFLVSVPIFCDSGFVVLFPIAKALSATTKKSVITLGLALASGLVITHTVVPPTPGPVGAAGIFGANVGSVILWGIVVAIPMATVSLLYARWYGKKLYQISDENGQWVRPSNIELTEGKAYDFKDSEDMPSTLKAFMPIIIPIILILINTIIGAFSKTKGLEITGLYSVLSFLGTPIVAVGIGLIVAILTLTTGMSKEKVTKELEVGIQSAGIIILVTGGGGALGRVLTDSGVGTQIAESISKMNINPLLLPFIISTIIRFIQGSGTVAMLTSASISAPIVLALGINPVFATLSACVGSVFFSYFNDSMFWVVNRSLGLSDAKEQLRGYSIVTTLAWAAGFITIVILNMVFG